MFNLIIAVIAILAVSYAIYKYWTVILIKILLFRPKLVPNSVIIGNSILINYKFDNILYKIYLPHKHIRFATRRVFATKKDSTERLDITQQKGIDYYIKAEDLGYDQLVSQSIDGTISVGQPLL